MGNSLHDRKLTHIAKASIAVKDAIEHLNTAKSYGDMYSLYAETAPAAILAKLEGALDELNTLYEHEEARKP